MRNCGVAQKIMKRRGGLKLSVYSYRKPNPQPLIPSYQSLVTSHQPLLIPNPQLPIPAFKLVVEPSPQVYMGRCPKVVFKSPVTSHQSLLTSEQSFHLESKDGTPHGLPPEPSQQKSSPFRKSSFLRKHGFNRCQVLLLNFYTWRGIA